MPTTLLPPVRVLRQLLRTPATTWRESQAISAAVDGLAATCIAQASSGERTPDEDVLLLLQ